MPTLRRMTPEEEMAAKLRAIKPVNVRQQIAQEYDQLIGDLGVDDYAITTLDDGDSKATTRNRLKAAAERKGLTIVFHRTRDTTVAFHLEEAKS